MAVVFRELASKFVQSENAKYTVPLTYAPMVAMLAETPIQCFSDCDYRCASAQRSSSVKTGHSDAPLSVSE